MNRRYFHSFDALRFFSFLLVFLLHVPKRGKEYIDFFLKSGGVGVAFFFVLSGFLITYILLFEKEHKNFISLKKFFARRILRIWPLFYLMIVFAYLSPYILQALNIPYKNEGYAPDLITSIVFGENYKMMITDSFPDGAPLRAMWTICIEEHFYIIWGVSLFFLSSKKVPILIIFSIVLANIIRPLYSYFGISHIDILSNIDYFAYGAIPAYILMFKENYMSYVEKIPVYLKYCFLVFTASVVFILPNLTSKLLGLISPSILGVLFSLTILFTLGKNSIHINNNHWFSKLGVYTYGLYLYHSIIILLLIHVYNYLSFLNWYVFVISSLLITILVSVISYHLFEKQFLKLKKHFY